MAVALIGLDIGFMKADADLSAKQFYGIKISTTDFTFSLASAGACDGILQDKPAASGRAGSFRVSGVSKVVLGGTVVAGSFGKTDSAGKFVAAETDKDQYVCKYVEGGDSGDTVTALLVRGHLGA